MHTISITLIALAISSVSFAKDFCSTSVRVSIPSHSWVQTSQLKEVQGIFKTITEKGYLIEENPELFLAFQHGSYKKKTATYIMTRITLRDIEGKILYQSDREKRFSNDDNLVMKKIQLMQTHIKFLPKCSRFSKD